MQILQRKYWFIKIFAILLIQFIAWREGKAQPGFLRECNALFARDITEDNKGCLLAVLENRILRINPYGRVLWLRNDNSIAQCFSVPDSNSYVLSSPTSEFGGFGMVAYDYFGNISWSKYHSVFPEASSVWDFIQDTARKQYIVVGVKNKITANPKMKYWIAGVDYRGNILWEKEFRDSGLNRYYARVFKNKKTGGYFLLSNDDNNNELHEIFNVDSLGNVLNRNPIEPSPCDLNRVNYEYQLQDLTYFSDSSFIASVFVSTLCSPLPEDDGGYFYFYNYKGELTKKEKHPWVASHISHAYSGGILTSGGNFIAKLNSNLDFIWSKELFDNNTVDRNVEIKKVAQSMDGGFYGIADGYRCMDPPCSQTAYIVLIFKTDSLGNINYEQEYIEKEKPVMLQPNPARDAVRIAIPYYCGTIRAQFYTLYGSFLWEQTQSERIPFDIRKLTAGIYVIKATITETGEQRTMKLVVE